MKKLLLMANMFVATVCNTKVVLWDDEDKDVGNDVVVTGGVIGKGTHQNTLSAGKKEFYK